jgi:uncharacterized protein (TIGR01777 family)
MNIGLTGASGLIGRKILDLALRRGHEIIAFTRSPQHAIPGCTMRPFSLEEPPDITGCEAIIHLAGETVAGLWTAAKKRRIVESRVQGTRRIAEAINAAPAKPEVLVSGSAVGFYGDCGEEELTETADAGAGFLADTVRAWEAEAAKVQGVRVAMVRTAMVLGAGGGALPLMRIPFRLGLGGRLGSGRQWVPWIHLDDIAQLFLFAVENLDVHGPINGTAPWPVRNEEFTHLLAKAVHRPAFIPVPAFVLKAALRGFSAELLDSKRVLPAAAAEHGFGFRFPELEEALKNLLP